jgi:hypothetical protein
VYDEYDGETTLNRLLSGNKIVATLIDKENFTERIVFVTDKDIVEASTYGDCCSETWFADFVNWDNLFDSEVMSVEVIPLPAWVSVEDGRGRQSEDKAYGFKIATTRGPVEIIYRNSSNGYYGGNLVVKVLKEVPGGMVEVRSDWQDTRPPNTYED